LGVVVSAVLDGVATDRLGADLGMSCSSPGPRPSQWENQPLL